MSLLAERWEDDLLIARGSFGRMEAQGETLCSRWDDLVGLVAEGSSQPCDVVKRYLVGKGYSPIAAELADDATYCAIGEEAMETLVSARIFPVRFDPVTIPMAVQVMDGGDWSPHWRAVQALCVLHGVSMDAAHAALCNVPGGEADEMHDLSYRTGVVAAASLFIQHSEARH